jgi:hypothetical protein
MSIARTDSHSIRSPWPGLHRDREADRSRSSDVLQGRRWAPAALSQSREDHSVLTSRRGGDLSMLIHPRKTDRTVAVCLVR